MTVQQLNVLFNVDYMCTVNRKEHGKFLCGLFQAIFLPEFMSGEK
jgi:hypothetical protein